MNMRAVLYMIDLDDACEATLSGACRRLNIECVRPASWSAAADDGFDGTTCFALPLPSRENVRSVTEKIERLRPGGAIVFVAKSPDLRSVVEAMRAGADDVLGSFSDEAQVDNALRQALAVSAGRRDRFLRCRMAQAKLARLSDGERQVLGLMLEGKVNKVVAARLGIALRTVENRRKQIFTKLGTRGFAEIVRLVQDTERLVGQGLGGEGPVSFPTPFGLTLFGGRTIDRQAV